MKILLLGQLHTRYLSNTYLRMLAMKDLGHEVFPMCNVAYLGWGGRVLGAPFRRLGWGPPVSRLNRDLVELACEVSPDIIWVEKGTWIGRETLAEIKTRCNPLLVHYTPDPAIRFHRDRHFLRAIPEYDLIVTTKSYEVDEYLELGAQCLISVPPSFDLKVHKPCNATPAEYSRYRSDVAFVGSYCDGRETFLDSLAGTPIDLGIWGNGWKKYCPEASIRGRLRGEGISGRDYALALACSDIGLGLLSPLVPDRSTTRSVEIPACGTFLLAERTEEHLALFEEGREAEFFDSEEELLDKVEFFLSHPAERERIARAGYDRCIRSGYSNRDQVRSILRDAEAMAA